MKLAGISTKMTMVTRRTELPLDGDEELDTVRMKPCASQSIGCRLPLSHRVLCCRSP